MLRCPHCGGRHVLRHWLAMRESCPDCGLVLAVGNRPGAYILNIAMAEVVLMVVLGAVVLRTWPTPPFGTLQWLAPLLMVVMPLLFYPFSKMMFVAIDVAMNEAGGLGPGGETFRPQAPPPTFSTPRSPRTIPRPPPQSHHSENAPAPLSATTRTLPPTATTPATPSDTSG